MQPVERRKETSNVCLVDPVVGRRRGGSPCSLFVVARIEPELGPRTGWRHFRRWLGIRRRVRIDELRRRLGVYELRRKLRERVWIGLQRELGRGRQLRWWQLGGGSSSGGRSSSSGGGSSGGSSSSGSGGSSSGTSSSGGGGDSGVEGGTNANCPGASASEFALVQAWLNNTTATGALPNYAYSNIASKFPAGAAFNKLACSIAMSCVEWAPMETNWLRKCEAVLTSAIVAESSYNPASVVPDSYSTRTLTDGTKANDPTVGLLQIRFSSTAHDFNYNGPMAKMTAIGCNWPSALTSQADSEDFWGTQGGTTTYLNFMEDVSCNIGLASWYYFYNATGNGGSNAVWIGPYCSGSGIAGTMVDGLLSHLMGGNYPRPADANNAYPWGIECCACGNPSGCTCNGCTGRFAAFMGIGTTATRPSPDPFQETLAPEPTKYCK